MGAPAADTAEAEAFVRRLLDSGNVREYIDAHGDELTPALAQGLHTLTGDALQGGAFDYAVVAGNVAASVNARIGERAAALECRLLALQGEFQSAKTVDDYDAVRSSLLVTEEQAAVTQGAERVRFEARGFAVQCGHFACEVATSPEPEESLLRRSLEDVLVLLDGHPWPLPQDRVHLFMAFVFPTLDLATARYWLDKDGGIQSALRRISAPLDAAIPAEVPLSSDPARDAAMAEVLARVAVSMADDPGARRLEAAARRAEVAGDVEAFISLVHTLYPRSKQLGGSADSTALVAAARSASDRLRGLFKSRAGRLWAAQQLDESLADFLADELVEGELDPDMFVRVESIRARVLLDSLGRPVPGVDGSALSSGDVAAAETAFMQFAVPRTDDDMWAELRLASMLPIGGPWDRSQRRALLDQIESEYARLGAVAPPVVGVAPLARVQEALRDDEALVQYIVARRIDQLLPDVWALVVTGSNARAIRVAKAETFMPPEGQRFAGSIRTDGRAPVDFTPLNTLVVEARVGIRRGDDKGAATYLRALGRLLLDPLLEQGLVSTGHRRLLIVPHRVLHYVPYCALSGPDGEPLAKYFAVTVAPSATVWAHLQSGGRPPASRFVGLANPDLNYTRLPQLEQSARELEAIQQRLSIPHDTRCGSDATESFLVDAVPGAGIVHLATHGDFPEDDALDMQRLLLSADGNHDGRLHAAELRRLDLHAARLVVMSVCNGGLYRFGPGDEPYGLLPAAMIAGAENVIGTLWPIEDDIGRLFMKELYRHLPATGPSEALRRTALQFRDEGALVGQWAAFTVVGSGRELGMGDSVPTRERQANGSA